MCCPGCYLLSTILDQKYATYFQLAAEDENWSPWWVPSWLPEYLLREIESRLLVRLCRLRRYEYLDPDHGSDSEGDFPILVPPTVENFDTDLNIDDSELDSGKP